MSDTAGRMCLRPSITFKSRAPGGDGFVAGLVLMTLALTFCGAGGFQISHQGMIMYYKIYGKHSTEADREV